MSARPGVTLIELLVVLVLLGFLMSITGVSLFTMSTTPADPQRDQVSAARARALRTGEPVQVTLSGPDTATPPSIVAMPDGSVVGDSILRIDRLTGRPIAGPQR